MKIKILVIIICFFTVSLATSQNKCFDCSDEYGISGGEKITDVKNKKEYLFYAEYFPSESICFKYDGIAFQDVWSSKIEPAIIADIKGHPVFQQVQANTKYDIGMTTLSPANGLIERNSWSKVRAIDGYELEVIKLTTNIAQYLSDFRTCSSFQNNNRSQTNSTEWNEDESLLSDKSKEFAKNGNKLPNETIYQKRARENRAREDRKREVEEKNLQDAQNFIDNQNRQLEQSKQYQDGLQNSIQQGVDNQGNIDAARLAYSLPKAQTTEQAYTNLAVTGVATIGQILQQNRQRKEAWSKYVKAINENNDVALMKAYEEVKNGVGFTDKSGMKQGVWSYYTKHMTLSSEGVYRNNLKEGLWEQYDEFVNSGQNFANGTNRYSKWIRSITSYSQGKVLETFELTEYGFPTKQMKNLKKKCRKIMGDKYTCKRFFPFIVDDNQKIIPCWRINESYGFDELISVGEIRNGKKHGVWKYVNKEYGKNIGHKFSMLDGKPAMENTIELVLYDQGIPLLYKLYKYTGRKITDAWSAEYRDEERFRKGDEFDKAIDLESYSYFELLKVVEMPKLIDSKTPLDYLLVNGQYKSLKKVDLTLDYLLNLPRPTYFNSWTSED